MLKIAFFFIINLQLAPELIVDRFITFQNEGHFYIITEKDIYKTDDGQSYSVYKHNAHFPHFNFNFLKVDKKGYLISKGGGLVYVFEKNEIYRIDNSFDHRNKYQSSLFEYQKKIFSFGGYGLFTDKNNLTYFDDSTKEWFDYNYFPNETQPTPRRLAISKVIESDLYVFGGFQKKINEQLDVYTEYLQDLWRLDLNSHGWEYCGETTISDLLDKKIDLNHVKIVPYKENHLLITKQNCLLIDIKNNIIKKFEGFNSAIMTGAKTISFNPNSNLFMIISNNHVNGKNNPIFMREQDFLSDNVSLFDLLKTTNNSYKFLFYLALILFIIFLIFMRKTENIKDKILKKREKIRQQLNLYENRILDELLEDENYSLENPYILSFYEPNMSYESKTKKLRVSLKKMNRVISENIKSSKDAIVKENSNYDKRVRIVRLK